MTQTSRCPWAKGELYHRYHDEEWGVPLHDDRKLFELLILEGAQAGLSWETILKKRENYRDAFDSFDAHRIAAYDDTKIASLLANTGIVRNKLKINAAVKNSQEFLRVQDEFGSFDAYIWRFVDGSPRQNAVSSLDHYLVSNAGDFVARGWSVSLQQVIAHRLRGSIDYTVTTAHWQPSAEAAILDVFAPSAVRTGQERMQDVTTSLETEIPVTATTPPS